MRENKTSIIITLIIAVPLVAIILIKPDLAIPFLAVLLAGLVCCMRVRSDRRYQRVAADMRWDRAGLNDITIETGTAYACGEKDIAKMFLDKAKAAGYVWADGDEIEDDDDCYGPLTIFYALDGNRIGWGSFYSGQCNKFVRVTYAV